jgi:hypothetical protein
MKNSVKMGMKHALLSPLVGVACVVGGAVAGAAIVTAGAVIGSAVMVAGVVGGATAPVWFTVAGVRRGKKQDALALAHAAPAVPVDNTAAAAEAIKADPEATSLLNDIKARWKQVAGESAPANG